MAGSDSAYLADPTISDDRRRPSRDGGGSRAPASSWRFVPAFLTNGQEVSFCIDQGILRHLDGVIPEGFGKKAKEAEDG